MCELRGIQEDRDTTSCGVGVLKTESPAHIRHATGANRRSYCIMSLFLVVGSLLFLACEEESDAERLAALDSEIRTLVADASCNDLADCRVIGYGAKPCGGPWTYLIYCVRAVDTARLASLVSIHYELERAINLKEGVFSDCSVPTPPHLGIIDGKCAGTLGR